MTGRAAFATALAEVCERTGWIGVDQEVQIDFDSGRSQSVRIEFFEFEGDELVRFYTTIGDAERIDPMRLSQGLRISFGLPHGALAQGSEHVIAVLVAERFDRHGRGQASPAARAGPTGRV